MYSNRCAKKAWWKNDSGRKALCVLKNMGKILVFLFSVHIKINDEVELKH